MITNNLEYMELVQSYINAGRASLTDQFHHRIVGFNHRLSELQAAVLGPQLDRLPQQAAIRERNMKHFESRMQNMPAIKLLKPEPRITRLAPYGYVIKYFAEKPMTFRARHLSLHFNWKVFLATASSTSRFIRARLFPLDPHDFPALSWGREKPLDLRSMYSCPEAERAAYHEAVWFPHYLFLGSTAMWIDRRRHPESAGQ